MTAEGGWLCSALLASVSGRRAMASPIAPLWSDVATMPRPCRLCESLGARSTTGTATLRPLCSKADRIYNDRRLAGLVGLACTKIEMLRIILGSILNRSAVLGADRLINVHGTHALFMARHAVKAARERGRSDYWSRVLAEVECRSAYRPW